MSDGKEASPGAWRQCEGETCQARETVHSSRYAQPQSEGCPVELLSVHNLGLHRDAEIAFAIALQRISQLLEQAPQMQNCHTFLLTGIPNG